MSNDINIPPLDTEWLHRARQRHEEIEAEVTGITGPLSLELQGGIFLRSALAMLDIALPPDGEPHPKARLCAEDAMFQMMMGGICMGRINEMRGGEAQEN
jgi:hypothetical protein